MNVLGIETSCDETAASVVQNGRKVISNIVSSSLKFHQEYGGIVPEIAFRKQLETITGVVDCALKEASLKLKDIKLISVTDGPGLLGSLLVGISFAKSLALSREIPLLGVNHLYSHIFAGFLNPQTPSFPFVGLVVSGGHTSLYYVKDFDEIKLLGSTQDDAAGEAFDKAAKILGLGYPGGPIIEKLAGRGRPNMIRFNCSNTRDPLDFSFSGIKTAVLYYVQKHRPAAKDVRNICASFQEAVLEALVEKSILACKKKQVKVLAVGGGVAANNRLREKLVARASEEDLKVFFAEKKYCLDNAAMVAGYGYRLFKKGCRSDLNLNVE
jgi:N6-L-threonylcarbamoyladenine synthase